MLFRSAVKQVCQRRGLLATFMCRPGLANITSSGWHLHQSLTSRAGGGNAFASDARSRCPPVGLSYVAGLIEHAVPSLPFAAPTVNGYKRFRPYSFAPDRVAWAIENRGALVRVQGSPGDASAHVEYRAGEPAANPYLYLAASLAAGLDGVRAGADAAAGHRGRPVRGRRAWSRCPRSLAAAVKALDGDAFYRGAFGDTLVDYLVMMKRAEIGALRGGARRGGEGRFPGRGHRLGDARVLRVLLNGPSRPGPRGTPGQ